jgi:hypothetical protein
VNETVDARDIRVGDRLVLDGRSWTMVTAVGFSTRTDQHIVHAGTTRVEYEIGAEVLIGKRDEAAQ